MPNVGGSRARYSEQHLPRPYMEMASRIFDGAQLPWQMPMGRGRRMPWFRQFQNAGNFWGILDTFSVISAFWAITVISGRFCAAV